MSALKHFEPGQIQGIIADNSGLLLLHFSFPCLHLCELFSRDLETLVPQFEDRIAMAEVEIPMQAPYIQEFELRSIPTLVLFEGAQEVERVERFWSPEALASFLQTVASFYN